MARHTGQFYLVALGSNRRHPLLGDPRTIVAAAMDLIDGTLGKVAARSRVIDSTPVGPSRRTYANAALTLDTDLDPPQLLECLHYAERALGRVRRGQSWRERVIDLDIVLWSGGIWTSPGLAIPHPQFRTRDFVLAPARDVAPDWRDPATGLTLRQLHARLTAPRPLPR